jgi:UDP-N-acetylmuramate dehydrogenase
MKILHDQNLAKYTTINIGGLVKTVYLPTNLEEFIFAIDECNASKLAFFVLGGGSNTVFDDQNLEYDQAVICLREFDQIIDQESVEGQLIIKTQPGLPLQKLVDFALFEQGFSDLIGLNRVPGTVAGAVVGNAGAYGTEIKDVVHKVKYINKSQIQTETKPVIFTLQNEECKFEYRNSFFKSNPDFLIVEIEFLLSKTDNIDIAKTKYTEIAQFRDQIYPVGYQSPGSLFKNLIFSKLDPDIATKIPKDWVVYGDKLPVGKLLEELGLKGYEVGGIKMTDRHPNIMWNKENGSFSDCQAVIKHLQTRVKVKFGIDIEPEVRFIKGKF